MKAPFAPSFILAFLVFSLFSGCGNKASDVEVSTPNEGITTFIYVANPTAGGPSVVAKWNQKIGSDGNPIGQPDTTQAFLRLRANSLYTGEIALYDSTQTPPADGAKEIRELSSFHQFFYQPIPTNQALVIPNTPNPNSPILNLFITAIDHDSSADQYTVGLSTVLATLGASQGRLRVVLRHQPNGKDGTYAPGSSDIDIWLRVIIEP